MVSKDKGEKEMRRNKRIQNKKQKSISANHRKNVLKAIIVIVLIFGAIFIANKLYERYQNRIVETTIYNGIEFFKDAKGFWHAKIPYRNYTIAATMYYSPPEVENISIERNVLPIIYNRVLSFFYVSLPPESSAKRVISAIELSKILGTITNKPIFFAVTYPTAKTIMQKIPVVDCKNSSLVVPVIMLLNSDTTQITTAGTCIIISGPTEKEILRAVNAFDYYILGVLGGFQWSQNTTMKIGTNTTTSNISIKNMNITIQQNNTQS